MQPKRLFLSTIACGVLAALAAISPAAAQAQTSPTQTWPTKPVTLVVPYAAGGNVDVSTRILQAALGNSLGQSIIVENRAGGGGLLAGEYVARAEPDGHTVFVGSTGLLLFAPLTMAKPPYEWDKSFVPVTTLAVATNMLLARPTLPAKTVAEVVAFAKQNPGKLTVATSNRLSINFFLGELLKQKAGIDWTWVHYKGNAPAVNDLIAGHVDLGFQQLSDSVQHIETGKLRPLAVIENARTPGLPDVPTMAEAGYPEVEGVNFNGLFVPKGTPRAVVDRLGAAVRAALGKPEVIEQFKRLGSDAKGSTPEEFRAFLTREQAKWAEVVKHADIKTTD